MFQPIFSRGRAAPEGIFISVLSAGVLSRNMRRIEILVKKKSKKGTGNRRMSPAARRAIGLLSRVTNSANAFLRSNQRRNRQEPWHESGRFTARPRRANH